MPKVTVIIPYKEDRGWLSQAIASVPKNVQLILAQGEGSWPQNFNKVLGESTGDFIKYLHEDDMLTPNCINDSFAGLWFQECDFIHGNAIEIFQGSSKVRYYIPRNKKPDLQQLLNHNSIHSATTMYSRKIFDKIGGFSENPKYHSFEEYEFNLRCLKAGFTIGYVDSNLAYYRRHEKQIIKNVSKLNRSKYRNELIQQYV